jgi:hypothetical protein
VCNPTSQPPRRELYELEQTIRTQQGPFLLPKPQVPRIGSDGYHEARPDAVAVYNAEYLADGTRYTRFDKPWTVIGRVITDYKRFSTHAAAIAYAFSQVPKKEEKEAA